MIMAINLNGSLKSYCIEFSTSPIDMQKPFISRHSLHYHQLSPN